MTTWTSTAILLFTMIATYFGGYLQGRTKAMRDCLDSRYKDWMTHLKAKITCPTCDDQDFNGKHPLCTKCAIATLREMRICIPVHVWMKGKDAYDWAGHFEITYKKKHEIHDYIKKEKEAV
jgi:hypothetical protein